jgi:hypothetical protein
MPRRLEGNLSKNWVRMMEVFIPVLVSFVQTEE